jgi:hypothetical protein
MQSGGVRKLMTNESNARPVSSDLTFIKLFFQSTHAQQMHHALMPREVILSSWLIAETRDKNGGV